MRLRDVQRPLYEAVRYGAREKSSVLSNLDRFNFGVELEFNLISDQDNNIDYALIPGEIARRVPYGNKFLQILGSNSISDLIDQLKEVSMNSSTYGTLQDRFPPYFKELLELTKEIYSVFQIGNNDFHLCALFPVYTINPDSYRGPFTYGDLLETLFNKDRSDSVNRIQLSNISVILKAYIESLEQLVNIQTLHSDPSIKRASQVPMDAETLSAAIISSLSSENITRDETSQRTDKDDIDDARNLIGYPDTKFDIVPEGVGQIEFISETCSGDSILQCFNDAKEIANIMIEHGYTTSSKTGFHMSISYKGDLKDINMLKFLMFSDSYRQIVKSEHVRRYVESIGDDLFDITFRSLIDAISWNIPIAKVIEDAENKLSKSKQVSVNFGSFNAQNGRIELRWPGGNAYENRMDEYMDSAIRAMYALEIAYTPGLYQKEYMKSFIRETNKVWKQRYGKDATTIISFLKKIKLKYPRIIFSTYGSAVNVRMDRRGYDIKSFSNLQEIEQDIDQMVGES